MAAAVGKEEGLCGVRGPCQSFCRRCKLLVREQRSRFYILRRCVVMLVCWRDASDS